MTEHVNIRAYNAQDKERILELLRLNTPAYFAPEEEKDLVYFLDHEIEYYYVIEVNHVLAGCGGFNFSDDPTTGKISWDILHPDYQGKSLGTQLVAHRISKLKTFKDLKQIIVRTTQLVFPFYEKCGFALKDIQKDYWAKGFDLYYMVYSDRIN